jgi:CelD/BcsL family acetyltransferase involved in cellulose biosynthesis
LLEECYGYRALAVVDADEEGQVRSGIPLLEVRRPLGGRRWVSLPFTDHCPPLVGASKAQEFGRGLRALQGSSGIAEIELRGPLEATEACSAPVAVTHVLELEADVDKVYRGFSKSQVQRNIKRAQRESLEVRTAERAEDLTHVFYGLHLETRRRLGTPIQPRRFFRLLWERLLTQGFGYVLLVYTGKTAVAGAVFLDWNGSVTYKYGASDAAHWSLRPNHLLFWNAIERSCREGRRRFDFGRTDFDNEGLRAFKSGWAASEEPLVYTSIGGAAPQPGLPRAARMLAPLIRRSPRWVCRAVGETLYKYAA